MKTCSLIRLAFALAALYLAALRTHAQLTYSPYAFTNLAGRPGSAGTADGTGTVARFTTPHGVAVDGAGNIYVGDTFNHAVRRISPAGAVTTIAGSAGNKGYADGVGNAEAPRFNSPIGLSADSSGNLYVADNGNEIIRKVTPAGVVTTVAGRVGIKGSVNATGTNASFNSPNGTVVDGSGNIFVADLVNRTIRRIAPGGIVTNFAGTTASLGTNDGVGTAARFNAPMGLAVDAANNIYVADQGANSIRKITPGAAVTTLAGLGGQSGTNNGTGTGARFLGPQALAVDNGGNVYVCDTGNHTIRMVTPGGVVTTIAGSPGLRGTIDGTNGVVRFDTPRGIVVDAATNIYVAAAGKSTIRKLVLAGTNCVVTTLAGGENGSFDGTGTAAQLDTPYGLAVDGAGNIYAVDRNNHDIRKITPAGVVTTFAGLPGQAGSTDGTGAGAQFNAPEGLAVDENGNIYVSDYFNNAVRKIAPVGTNWVVTTLAGCPTCPGGTNDGPGTAARFDNAFGLTRDSSGNVYVADTVNKTVRKLTPAQPEWIVSTFAGAPRIGGSLDGTGDAARFASPLGLAADANGIYVADASSVRKITYDRVVTTLAGCTVCAPGANDGTGAAVLFGTARAVAVDGAGNLFVADSSSHLIRKLSPATLGGIVTTIGGDPNQAVSADGFGSTAKFIAPSGVAVDLAGNVYVVDATGRRVAKGSRSAQFPSGGGALSVSNGQFRLRVIGSSGGNLVLESSTNLPFWNPILTNPFSPTGLSLSFPVKSNQNEFFRGRLAP